LATGDAMRAVSFLERAARVFDRGAQVARRKLEFRLENPD